MKNKKQKNKEKDHLAKLKIAQRKAFQANIKLVGNVLAGEDAYSLIPAFYLDFLFQYRFYNLQVKPKNTSDFTSKEIEKLNKYFKDKLDNVQFEISENGTQIPLYRLVVEGLTLAIHINKLTGEEFDTAQQLKSLFEKYHQGSDFFNRIEAALSHEIHIMGLLHSSLYDGFVFGEYVVEISETTKAVNNIVCVEFEKPIKKQFTINGNTRPATRLAWAHHNIVHRHVTLKPSQIGLWQPEDQKDDTPLEIYVQSHALIRLEERLNLDICIMHYCIYTSIFNLNYHWDSNGRLMIHYYYLNTKTGYLVCSVQEGKILIHSFLFLTFNGTPEGNKLYELTGLGKIDKKYLAIDNLWSFLSYNIDENEFVKDIFEKAGCAGLLDMKNEKQYILTQRNSLMNAEIIAKYLTDIAKIPEYQVAFE